MDKKVVVITGASSGIGAAMAQTFSAAGYAVGLVARRLETMEKMHLPNAVCEAADVTDYDSLKKAFQQIEAKLGAIDCLVNNAGFMKNGEFTTIPHEDNINMIKVNFMGVLNGIEIVLPAMRERQSGTIINISSLADRNARPQVATYAATKAAVKSLTESLRMANAKYGVRICNLAPAKVLTPMVISAGLNDNQIISAETLAKTALWIYQQPATVCVRDVVIAPTHYEA